MRIRRRPPNLFTLGGWLFADLMLVLTVVFIGTGAYVAPPPTPVPTSTPTATPTTTSTPVPPPTPTGTPGPIATVTPTPQPTVTPTPTPGVPVLDREPLLFQINMDTDGLLGRDPRAQTELLDQFKKVFEDKLIQQKGKRYEEVMAAIVITFGMSSRNDQRPYRGVRVATEVNAILLKQPGFQDAAHRDYLQYVDDSGRLRDVEFEVFLYASR